MCHKLCHFVCHHNKKLAIKKLTIRKGIYYYRSKQIIDKKVKDIRISLHTTNYLEAILKMDNIKRKITLESQIKRLDALIFDCREDIEQCLEFTKQRTILQSELDKINNMFVGSRITVNPTDFIYKPNHSSNFSTNNPLDNRSHAPIIPTIGEMVERFQNCYDFLSSSKQEHNRHQASKLQKIFSTEAIDPKLPVTTLNSFDSVVKINKYLDKVTSSESKKPIKPDTRGQYLKLYKRFLVFCQPECQVLPDVINSIEIPRTKKQDKIPHTAYKPEHLQKMFNPDISKAFFQKHPNLFWMSLISLFSGARKNAAATLQYKDIRPIKGIYAIDFIDDAPNKDYKNEATIRKIPIAKQFLDIGFYEWIQNRKKFLKANDIDYIFPECTIQKPQKPENKGKLSNACLRPLFDYLKKIGIKHPDFTTVEATKEKFDFHSFRKNANKILLQHNVANSDIYKIIGWEQDDNEKMSKGTYDGSTYSDQNVVDLKDTMDNCMIYEFLSEEFAQWKDIMANTYEYKEEKAEKKNN